MRVKAHHLAASFFFAGSIFLGSLAWFGTHVPTALASCPSGANMNMAYPSPSSTNTLIGNQNLVAYSTSTIQASGLTFVVSSPAYTVLGQAVAISGTQWRLNNWDSRSLPNGTYQMMAIAHYGTNTNLDCASATVPFSINNASTQQPKITAIINPNTSQLLPGGSASFSAGGVYEDQFGRQTPLPAGTTYHWITGAGDFSAPDAQTTVFTAGSTTGTFNLYVTVSYNGLLAQGSAPVKVTKTPAATPAPTPVPTAAPTPSPTQTAASSGDNSAPLTAAEVARLSTMPTIFRPTEPTNSNPVVAVKTLSCLENKVGESRFAEISSGQSQPTAAERHLAASCFSGTDRIPALLAPVEPSRVSELASAETTLVKMNGVKNTTVTNDKGDKVAAIIINGTGAANSSIFIYIFSDPMVLRAETDSQGEWSYILRNPLKPGDHEVYAVAEKDSSSFVRTQAIPISIAAAAPGSTQDSLVIERKWQPAQLGYVAGALAMMVVAVFFVLRLRRHQHLVIPGLAGHPASSAPTLILPTNASPLTPAPPAEPPSNVTKA